MRPNSRSRDEFDQDDETADSEDATSLDVQNSVGCAYYDALNGKLFLMEDAQDTSGQHELITMILEQVSPNVILVSSKAEERLINCVEQTALKLSAGTIEEGEGGPHESARLIIRPSQDFSTSAGSSSLVKFGLMDARVQIGSVPSPSPNSRSHESIKTWTGNPLLTARTLINPEASQLTLSAFSALINFLEARIMRRHGRVDQSEDTLQFNSVEMIRVNNFLHIGIDALSSLQIFEQEAHANLHSNKTKEGLSLYGILNECVTYGGKSLLKHWLIRPSTQSSVIASRADAVQYFLRAENEDCVGRMRQHLKAVGNMPRTIVIISSGKGRVSDWRAILNFLRAADHIREQADLLENADLPLLQRILRVKDDLDLQVQAQKINDVIDWEESKINGGRVSVRVGIDNQLDELREDYAGLESKLDHLAQKLSNETPFERTPDFTIAYYPQIGYLCRVPRHSEDNEAPFISPEGWEFQFETGLHAHYKNTHMRDLDRFIGDLTTRITDREIEIMNILEEALVNISSTLLNLANDLATLDCLLSLARIARLREWVRPEIVEGNLIEITGGRHPLVEACVETYISNDTHMVGGRGLGTNEGDIRATRKHTKDDEDTDMDDTDDSPPRSMLVLTGANFSGKSVYLKQVALIVILSQIGSYVPAQRARIGIHDAIFTRVTTTESSSRDSSAFMIDLQQVSFMLRNCTRRSLLLLDEFGKGTDPIDGQALFCSVVEHLITRGADCPKTILSTHFHAVFSSGFMPSGLPIDYSHMSIVLSTAGTAGPARLANDLEPTYLYTMRPGLVTSSHALGCAALFGAPTHVRLRAQRVSELLSKNEILELMDVEMDEEAVEELDRLEAVVRRFLETDLNDHGDDERMMKSSKEENEVMSLLRHEILLVEDVERMDDG